MDSTVLAETEAFIARIVDEASQQRLPELFTGGRTDALYSVSDRHGVSVVAAHTRSLAEEQLIKLMKFRWGQYLHPTVNFNNPRLAYQAGMEHEPLSGVLPGDVHMVAGSVETVPGEV